MEFKGWFLILVSILEQSLEELWARIFHFLHLPLLL